MEIIFQPIKIIFFVFVFEINKKYNLNFVTFAFDRNDENILLNAKLK